MVDILVVNRTDSTLQSSKILYPVLYVANRKINLISFYYQYFIYYNIERLHIDKFIMSRGFFDDYWG